MVGQGGPSVLELTERERERNCVCVSGGIKLARLIQKGGLL